MGTGIGSLFIMTAWKVVTLWRDMHNPTPPLNPGSSVPDFLTAMSPVWFALGVIVTLAQTAFGVVATISDDKEYEILTIFLFPFMLVAYLISITSNPRKQHFAYTCVLCLCFVSWAWVSEGIWVIHEIKWGNVLASVYHAVRIAIQTFIFSWVLKLRADISRLPDKDLDVVLTHTIFTGGLQTLVPLFFLAFRTTKCMFEAGDDGPETCAASTWCSTFISIFFVSWWIMKIVGGSIRSVLTAVTAVCGMFLFSFKRAEPAAEISAVRVVGSCGIGAAFVVVISEVYSVSKEQNRRLIIVESREIKESDIDGDDVEDNSRVEECSWLWITACVFITSSTSLCYLLDAITLQDRWFMIGRIIFPVATASFFLSAFMKPQKTDPFYMRFLILHFISFIYFSDAIGVVGSLRKGQTSSVIFVTG